MRTPSLTRCHTWRLARLRFSRRKIQPMKGSLRFRLLVMTGMVSLAGPAFANHRTGDLPLPELLVAADLNEDGKLDLAVNVTGFDNVAILNGDGQANFTLNEHV